MSVMMLTTLAYYDPERPARKTSARTASDAEPPASTRAMTGAW